MKKLLICFVLVLFCATPTLVYAQAPQSDNRPAQTVVPEPLFIRAYVLANRGRDYLDDDELTQLAKDEYRMALEMCGPDLCLPDNVVTERSKRTFEYLHKYSLAVPSSSEPSGESATPIIRAQQPPTTLAPRPKPKTVYLPIGTVVFVDIKQKISTPVCSAGQHVSGDVVQGIFIPGTNKSIGSGALANLTITKCQSHPGVLGFRLDSLTIASNTLAVGSDEFVLRGSQPKYYSASNGFRGIPMNRGNEAVLLPSMHLTFHTGKEIKLMVQ